MKGGVLVPHTEDPPPNERRTVYRYAAVRVFRKSSSCKKLPGQIMIGGAPPNSDSKLAQDRVSSLGSTRELRANSRSLVSARRSANEFYTRRGHSTVL